MSFPADLPTLGLASIVVDMEQAELTPLFLAPFGLYDGVLVWEPVGPIDDYGDDVS